MLDGYYFRDLATEARQLEGKHDDSSWYRRGACLLELQANGLRVADFPESSGDSRQVEPVETYLIPCN